MTNEELRALAQESAEEQREAEQRAKRNECVCGTVNCPQSTHVIQVDINMRSIWVTFSPRRCTFLSWSGYKSRYSNRRLG